MESRWDLWGTEYEIIETPPENEMFTESAFLFHVEPKSRVSDEIKFIFGFDYERGIIFPLSLAGLPRAGQYSDILTALWSKYGNIMEDRLGMKDSKLVVRILDVGTDFDLPSRPFGLDVVSPHDIVQEFETIFDLGLSDWHHMLSEERKQLVFLAIAGSPTKTGQMVFASRYPYMIRRRTISSIDIIHVGDIQISTGSKRHLVIDVHLVEHSHTGSLGPVQLPKPALSIPIPTTDLRIPSRSSRIPPPKTNQTQALHRREDVQHRRSALVPSTGPTPSADPTPTNQAQALQRRKDVQH